jgi:hypothetical protein
MKNRTLEKTNVRIFNKYLLMKKKEKNNKILIDFYLTEITDYKKWKKEKETQDNLEKLKGKKVTDDIKYLMEKHKLYCNVNFHLKELDTNNKDGGGVEVPVNVVKVGG